MRDTRTTCEEQTFSTGRQIRLKSPGCDRPCGRKHQPEEANMDSMLDLFKTFIQLQPIQSIPPVISFWKINTMETASIWNIRPIWFLHPSPNCMRNSMFRYLHLKSDQFSISSANLKSVIYSMFQKKEAAKRNFHFISAHSIRSIPLFISKSNEKSNVQVIAPESDEIKLNFNQFNQFQFNHLFDISEGIECKRSQRQSVSTLKMNKNKKIDIKKSLKRDLHAHHTLKVMQNTWFSQESRVKCGLAWFRLIIIYY